MTDAIVIRPFAPADIAEAIAIQKANFPAFLVEDAPAFLSRIRVPATCSFAALRADRLVGYILAHRWVSRSPPPVGATLDPRDATGNILFIHDIAVAKAAKQRGLGRQLVDHAIAAAVAHGLDRAELIAIEGAASFWSGLDFADEAGSPALAQKVAAYGPTARFMTKPIGPPPACPHAPLPAGN